MHGYDIDDNLGYAYAEALGLEAYADLGAGKHGRTFALEDGGVMKITLSADEAAAAMILLQVADDPELHGVVPKIREVRSVILPEGVQAYVIVREEVPEAFEDPDPETEADAMWDWMMALRELQYGLRNESPGVIAVALDRWGNRQPSLSDLVKGWKHLKETTGIGIRDMHSDNVGVSSAGKACIRDFSHVDLAPEVIWEKLNAIAPMPATQMAPVIA